MATLVIELDGDVHYSPEAKERDDNRTAVIEKYGIKVLRFPNDDVFKNTQFVVEEIERYLTLASK